jgi:hypothetical protein
MPKLTVKRSCGCWETHIYRSTPRAAQTLISRLQAGPCARCRDRQHLRPAVPSNAKKTSCQRSDRARVAEGSPNRPAPLLAR